MTDSSAPPRALRLLSVGIVLVTAGVMGTRPLVPLYALSLGIGPGEIGVLVAAFAILPLFIVSLVGSWMDRHGSAWIMVSGALLSALGLMLPFLMPDRAGLYLSQVAAGTGSTVFILSLQHYTGSITSEPWARERAMALTSMSLALGSFAGPLFSGFLADATGFGTAFLLMALPGFLALVVVAPVLWAPASGRRATGRAEWLSNPVRILGYHPYMGRAFMISVLVLMGKDMYVAYFPLYADAAGISASAIGIIIALHNGGAVVVRFAMLPMVRLFGKNPVIVLSVVMSGMFFLLLPLTVDIVLLTAISLALGLGLGIGQPLAITRTMNLSPPDKIGEVLGMRLAVNRLTQVATPLTVGAMVSFTGVVGVFFFVGAVMALGGTRLSVPSEAPVGPQRPPRQGGRGSS